MTSSKINAYLKYSIIIVFSFLFILNAQTSRPKIGLVLSGGGARGLAHVGILKLLDSLQIPIDYISGTSMGGNIGALYAVGYSGKELEQIVLQTDWMQFFVDRPARSETPFLLKRDDGVYRLELGMESFKPVVPTGFIQGQKISAFLAEMIYAKVQTDNFDELPIPFRCVAVDLIQGREIVLSRGPLPKALRATMSIPTVFSPVEWDEHLLIDGGVYNNFPADVVRDMGADIIIGVDVGGKLLEKKNLKSVVSVLNQTITLLDYWHQNENKQLCELIITPELGNYTAASFDQKAVVDIIRKGNIAARNHLDSLIRFRDTFISPFKNNDSTSGTARDKDGEIPRIFGLTVVGNHRVPFLLISNQLGIQPKKRYSPQQITERIKLLYALGYFEEITYELKPAGDDYVRLIVEVKEKPIRKMQLGFRYDSFYKFVGIISAQVSNFPIPGLRIENTLKFAGTLQYDNTISYPSRQLDLPIIPTIKTSVKSTPRVFYDWESGNKVADYNQRSFTGGIGVSLQLKNIGLLTTLYNHEFVHILAHQISLSGMDFPEFDDEFHFIEIELNLDKLDDPTIPHKGYKLLAHYDYSQKFLGSDYDFQQFWMRFYLFKTMTKKHTLGFQGYYTDYRGDLPIYKASQSGGALSFVGMNYYQIFGDHYGYLRTDYRFQYRKDIFIKIIGNTGLYSNHNQYGLIEEWKPIFGAGLGVMATTIIGPLELVLSSGSKSIRYNRKFQTLIQFSAGVEF